MHSFLIEMKIAKMNAAARMQFVRIEYFQVLIYINYYKKSISKWNYVVYPKNSSSLFKISSIFSSPILKILPAIMFSIRL